MVLVLNGIMVLNGPGVEWHQLWCSMVLVLNGIIVLDAMVLVLNGSVVLNGIGDQWHCGAQWPNTCLIQT